MLEQYFRFLSANAVESFVVISTHLPFFKNTLKLNFSFLKMYLKLNFNFIKQQNHFVNKAE